MGEGTKPRKRGRSPFEGLEKKDRKGLVEARRNAEAYLREPLPVVVRRELAAGRTPEQVGHWIARRTEGTALLNAAQVAWLAKQKEPRFFTPPAKPRKPPKDRAGGFWDGLRTESNPRAVRGGAPGLGKRR